MARAKKLAVYTPAEVADKLFRIKEEISAIEDSVKPLKEKEEILRLAMIEAIRAARLPDGRYRDNGTGINYTAIIRFTPKVVNLKLAQKWAQAQDCMRIDLVKAKKLLDGSGALPEGWEAERTDYLTITGIKSALEV